jgi:hypothetical protein
MFDQQIRKIIDFIDREIDFLQYNDPELNIVSVLYDLIGVRVSYSITMDLQFIYSGTTKSTPGYHCFDYGPTTPSQAYSINAYFLFIFSPLMGSRAYAYGNSSRIYTL